MNIVLKMLIYVSIVLGISCFKWRGNAAYFYYLEILTRLVSVVIPNVAGYDYDEIKYLSMHATLFVIYYTDSGL